ncbi:hypothetical protein HMPREF0083_00825 [Aneurinibacillus aneurinilyticus ATCC 12856]|uniref:Uncharacterized protein n=1 Tax=Aneurinibacillus aneurinilyticus ATCC 12856 TaxID=649747 RepID=U1WR27_ANEAE|nr:hypothetical protein HMPREF0083_00825 [Aneurinibacillus aneurinilyticus ATCC 12856]
MCSTGKKAVFGTRLARFSSDTFLYDKKRGGNEYIVPPFFLAWSMVGILEIRSSRIDF